MAGLFALLALLAVVASGLTLPDSAERPQVAAVAMKKKVQASSTVVQQVAALARLTGRSSGEVARSISQVGCSSRNALAGTSRRTNVGCTDLCKGNKMCLDECGAIQGMLCPAAPSGGGAASVAVGGTTNAAAWAAYAAAESVKDEVRAAVKQLAEQSIAETKASEDLAVKAVHHIEEKTVGKGTHNIAQAAAKAAVNTAISEEVGNVRTIAETAASAAMASAKDRHDQGLE